MTIQNKGFIAENDFTLYVLQNKTIELNKLDNSIAKFEVQDRPIITGSGNAEKWDIVVNPACRLQLKATTGEASTIVNMVPLRNLPKLAKHSLLDVKPLLDIMPKISKVTKLSELAEKSDWYDILHFFLFDGSATKTAQKWEQATALVEVSDNGFLLIEKNEAIDYYWERLTIEIRYRKTSKNPAEPFMHVRIEK